MTTETQVPMVPLRPNMFEMPDSLEGQPLLLGQSCVQCGETFAGLERHYCPNCSQASLERVFLSTHGEVFTYTLVHQQLRGSLVEAPYVMARVRLPEGVTVQTILRDVEPSDVSIGMPVEICLKKLREESDGSNLVNFFFRPLQD